MVGKIGATVVGAMMLSGAAAQVVCPGFDSEEYCDGTGDCGADNGFCDCPEGQALCNGGGDLHPEACFLNHPACLQGWVGDEVCDSEECYNEDCAFDGGDCDGEFGGGEGGGPCDLNRPRCKKTDGCSWNSVFKTCETEEAAAQYVTDFHAGVAGHYYSGDPCRDLEEIPCREASMCHLTHVHGKRHCSFLPVNQRSSKRGTESFTHNKVASHGLHNHVDDMVCGEAFSEHDCETLGDRCTWNRCHVNGVGYSYCGDSSTPENWDIDTSICYGKSTNHGVMDGYCAGGSNDPMGTTSTANECFDLCLEYLGMYLVAIDWTPSGCFCQDDCTGFTDCGADYVVVTHDEYVPPNVEPPKCGDY